MLNPGQMNLQVDASFGLAFRLATHLRRRASTCDDLHRLALTLVIVTNYALVELKFRQVDASLFTVWPPSASRHKLIASNVIKTR